MNKRAERKREIEAELDEEFFEFCASIDYFSTEEADWIDFADWMDGIL